MSLNQQLALAAAVLLVAGCQSSEPIAQQRPAAAPVAADTARDPADDLTATEAAIAGMNGPYPDGIRDAVYGVAS